MSTLRKKIGVSIGILIGAQIKAVRRIGVEWKRPAR